MPEDPIQPVAAPPDAPKLFYTRGNAYPRAVAWFSVGSFWGYLWHLAVSVIGNMDSTRKL